MYLAIDLWDKKCWLAVYIEWIVVPKSIVPRVKLIQELKKLVKEYNIKTIIVWLPFDLYWKKLKQLEKTKKFIEKLKIIFSELKIEWIDERFTSFEADNILDNLWLDKNNTQKDDISAVLILESYLKKTSN